MRKFVFDVDGTLTPSRGKIDPQFEAWFSNFIQREKVFLVTGSDYPKTVEQLGAEICESVACCYNCSGSDVWFKGKRVNSSDWVMPQNARDWLQKQLNESGFVLRTGNHLEDRPGMLNFSVVGRNATQKERALYVEYDEETGERERIAREFNYIFGQSSARIMAKVGGETGLDIFPIGKDKSQILVDFNEDDDIIFFGDKMDPGGNDEPLARCNTNGTNHHVSGWKETWELLKGYS